MLDIVCPMQKKGVFNKYVFINLVEGFSIQKFLINAGKGGGFQWNFLWNSKIIIFIIKTILQLLSCMSHWKRLQDGIWKYFVYERTLSNFKMDKRVGHSAWISCLILSCLMNLINRSMGENILVPQNKKINWPFV